MKKKRIITGLIILIIIAVLIFWGRNALNDNGNQRISTICKQINSSKNNKENIILFIENNNSDPTESIKAFSTDYKDIKIIRTSSTKIDKDCLKKELEEVGLYDMVKTSGDIVQVFYKAGTYAGSLVGPIDYENIEKYAIQKELIKINDNITLDVFKENIKDRYMLIMAAEERGRRVVTPLVNKYFKDYKYDIINIKSEEGKKIQEYLIENYTIIQGYPQVLYFENGKLLVNEEVFSSDESYQEVINKIQSLNS